MVISNHSEYVYDLRSIYSFHIFNILVDSNCLKVVNLLNDVAIDIYEISFFIAEANKWGSDLGLSFSPIFFVVTIQLGHYVAYKGLKD